MKNLVHCISIPLILSLAFALPAWTTSSAKEIETDPASLSRLHDIVVPPPISWWPLAPGWYVLLGMLLLSAAWLGLRLYRHYTANHYRRQALAELQRLQPLSRQFGGLSVAMGQVMELLKRTAFVTYPREQIASLNGVDWWKFRDQSIGSTVFVQSVGPTLERLTYGNPFETDAPRAEVDAAFHAVGTWIKNHQATAKRVS